ncbi:MAG: DNA gyrase/topoisomerase IV subunit A [Bacteroidetes bacterium]|nr:DNA gyrase/topoisomerase IV subunit A [Bacteroidota bacterium]
MEERADLDNTQEQPVQNDDLRNITYLPGMYETWFLDYASYVILERAVPHLHDGLKPVQRRLLHSMRELEDGRYNKVANIIGNTMKYHPHGDASIGDALVQMGQKDLLIDTQGNWGNIHTGDSAAASRYIEARLSKFALEVVFNPKTTVWKLSYDGRNKEPVTLPVKFPLLLAMGVEGIAVGLASKIMPHNFVELIDASIAVLKNESYELMPDFNTGGLADFSRYNDGQRGGKIRVRAKITQEDKKTLVITEIPFGTTTTSLIESIVSANEKGKIKIRKIEDNTAEHVEVILHLAPGISPDITIDGLFAFTNCEMSISPNTCLIEGDKPRFMGVREILENSTRRTVELLNQELEIEKAELLEQLHFASLEKIFIEERIYRDIEECETWEAVILAIQKGLEPFTKLFVREVTRDDIIRLTEIKIKRISKFDAFQADRTIKNLKEGIDEVQNHLDNMIEFAINYFRQIKKKYGKGRERKTEIRLFDTIDTKIVAVANARLYVNRKEGFAGTSLSREEFVCECSDIDDIIVFREDGTFIVKRVSDKEYVGKDVTHISVFNKNDERIIYNMIYRDGAGGKAMVKRFNVTSITRDKEYSLTKGNKGSKVLYFTANPNGEAEIVRIFLKPRPRMKKNTLDFYFSTVPIKGRGAIGNILTRNPVHRIQLKEEGVSTLGAQDIWFDDSVKRLNTDGYGRRLGAFTGDDKILAIMNSGTYRLYSYELTTHFDDNLAWISKFNPKMIISAVYFDPEQGHVYLKRFIPEVSEKKQIFIPEIEGARLLGFSTDHFPMIEVKFEKDKEKNTTRDPEEVNVHEFIGVKGFKAKGKRLAPYPVKDVKWLEPLPYEEPEEMLSEEPDGNGGASDNGSTEPEFDTVDIIEVAAETEVSVETENIAQEELPEIQVETIEEEITPLDKLAEEIPVSMQKASEKTRSVKSKPKNPSTENQITLFDL